jgi:GntR family transcriptional regulator / MocR family aminotransferase
MLVKMQGRGPLYDRIYRALRQAILSGEMPRGMRLPSTRRLAEESGVSRNTVLLAYDQLLAEGYIRGVLGSGTYVASELPEEMLEAGDGPATLAKAAPPSPAGLSDYGRRISVLEPAPTRPTEGVRFDFRYGLPGAQNIPFGAWRKLVSRRLRKASSRSIEYSAPEGLLELRRAIASYLRRARAVQCSPDNVLIVNGSQQALDLTARVLLQAGDRVVIEDPHYLGARMVFLGAGAKLLPCPVDSDGLDIDRAPRAASRARLAYVTPSHQFPTGAVMPLARRLALLRWAQATQAWIVEDDYDSEYRYGGRPVEAVQALDGGRQVIYVGTLSKTLFPALRLGYLVLPSTLVSLFRKAKFLTDRHTPTLQQEVLADFIAEGHFERHLRRTRTRNAARREALLEALRVNCGDRVQIEGSSAGLHMLVWLPQVTPSKLDSLVRRAAVAGVGVYPVTPNYLEPPRRSGLLLGYGSLEEDEIRQGIQRLGHALAG